MTEIPATMCECVNLTELNMEGNKLVELPVSLLSFLPLSNSSFSYTQSLVSISILTSPSLAPSFVSPFSSYTQWFPFPSSPPLLPPPSSSVLSPFFNFRSIVYCFFLSLTAIFPLPPSLPSLHSSLTPPLSPIPSPSSLIPHFLQELLFGCTQGIAQIHLGRNNFSTFPITDPSHLARINVRTCIMQHNSTDLKYIG